jgi:2-desacetyl-2-hydroxyethyl bacteriochlorophyllide A dehydrogenase
VRFVGPRQIELSEEPIASPGDEQLLVQTELSAISAGTEMLLFRGELPADSDVDADAISRNLTYPTPFGYCAVGRVIEAGRRVDSAWRGRLVFGFQPHASHYVARPESVLRVPDGLSAEDAVFLANMETAVNLIQDSAPLLGECVLVLGQGVVGLLSAALLHEFPLACLVTADRYDRRRLVAQSLRVTAVLDPSASDFREQAIRFGGAAGTGFDLVLELTGNPSALNDSLALTMFSGRVIVGSWFGSKQSPLELGGRFHRSRIRLVASQVSTIAPELSGRWNKERRFSTVWEALLRIRPSRWITHRFPLERAVDAYRMLDEAPGDTIQVVLTYS